MTRSVRVGRIAAGPTYAAVTRETAQCRRRNEPIRESTHPGDFVRSEPREQVSWRGSRQHCARSLSPPNDDWVRVHMSSPEVCRRAKSRAMTIGATPPTCTIREAHPTPLHPRRSETRPLTVALYAIAVCSVTTAWSSRAASTGVIRHRRVPCAGPRGRRRSGDCERPWYPGRRSSRPDRCDSGLHPADAIQRRLRRAAGVRLAPVHFRPQSPLVGSS